MLVSHISDSLEVFNLRRVQVDLMTIGNRRFMYHSAGWLILGAEDIVTRKGSKLVKSHAEEYHEAQERYPEIPNFDGFIRGWIGVGGSYKKGIIHFAPHVPAENIEMFDKAFDFIEAALENGFTKNSVLRGFPGSWEQKIKDVIPERKASLEQQIASAEKLAGGRAADCVEKRKEKDLNL